MFFNQSFALQGRSLLQNLFGIKRCKNSTINNLIQEFLIVVSYDPKAPYFISKIFMDDSIKNCARHCVTTFLLVFFSFGYVIVILLLEILCVHDYYCSFLNISMCNVGCWYSEFG